MKLCGDIPLDVKNLNMSVKVNYIAGNTQQMFFGHLCCVFSDCLQLL